MKDGSRDADLRRAASAGLLGVGAGAAGFVVDQMWRFPPTGATPEHLSRFVASNRTELLVAMLLNTIGVSGWLVFGAGVCVHLRTVARQEGVRAACFALGLVGFVTLLLAGFTSFWLLAYRAPMSTDPMLLYDVAFGLLAMSSAPTAIALWAYAEIGFRTRALPRASTLLAAVSAVAHIALFSSLIVRDGFWSLEGPLIILIPGTLFAWIVATSVDLLRHPA